MSLNEGLRLPVKDLGDMRVASIPDSRTYNPRPQSTERIVEIVRVQRPNLEGDRMKEIRDRVQGSWDVLHAEPKPALRRGRGGGA